MFLVLSRYGLGWKYRITSQIGCRIFLVLYLAISIFYEMPGSLSHDELKAVT